MKNSLCVCALCAVLFLAPYATLAGGNLLTNGNLDVTAPVEIVPGFFLPKPTVWVNEGSRSLSGPYEDEMSSEPWAGPAPTPVTADGTGLPHPESCGGLDCAVFFKAFSGSITDGAATGHLYQDVPATPGAQYELTGWAGAESNFLAGAEFAIDFLDAGLGLIGSSELDLLAAGLLVPNGQPFNYKQFLVSAIAPAGTALARARVSMIDGMPNPAGGGQAFVVDDFVLSIVPEPTTALLATLGGALILVRRRRSAR